MSGVGFDAQDAALLDKLNAGSWSKSFSPQSDVAWQDATTTVEEWRALYERWSLLLGSRHHDAANDEQRLDFARYQQMNLMLFTALFERTGLVFLESLFRDDDAADYHEYLTHFVKEETYHTLLFGRAIAQIGAQLGRPLKPLPSRHIEAFLGLMMWGLRVLPSRRLRHALFFVLFRFVEEISLQANTVATRAVNRPESLVPRIWQLHALDEARHVAFDDLMLRKSALPSPLKGMAGMMTTLLGASSSLLLNLNEIWAARALGLRVGYLELPRLMRGTTAEFKRRAFALLFKKRDIA